MVWLVHILGMGVSTWGGAGPADLPIASAYDLGEPPTFPPPPPYKPIPSTHKVDNNPPKTPSNQLKIKAVMVQWLTITTHIPELSLAGASPEIPPPEPELGVPEKIAIFNQIP